MPKALVLLLLSLALTACGQTPTEEVATEPQVQEEYSPFACLDNWEPVALDERYVGISPAEVSTSVSLSRCYGGYGAASTAEEHLFSRGETLFLQDSFEVFSCSKVAFTLGVEPNLVELGMTSGRNATTTTSSISSICSKIGLTIRFEVANQEPGTRMMRIQNRIMDRSWEREVTIPK